MDRTIGSIFFMIVGAYTAIHAYRLGIGHFSEPGSGFIFFLCALMLLVFALFDLVESFVKVLKTGPEQKSLWSGTRWKKNLLVMGGLAGYFYFFDLLGFLLSSFILMLFLFKAVEPCKWTTAILGSLITTLSAYVVFEVWLRVYFPKGFFWS